MALSTSPYHPVRTALGAGAFEPICSVKETGARSHEGLAKVMFTWWPRRGSVPGLLSGHEGQAGTCLVEELGVRADLLGAEQWCSCRGSPAYRTPECWGDTQEPGGEAENSWPGGGEVLDGRGGG